MGVERPWKSSWDNTLWRADIKDNTYLFPGPLVSASCGRDFLGTLFSLDEEWGLHHQGRSSASAMQSPAGSWVGNSSHPQRLCKHRGLLPTHHGAFTTQSMRPELWLHLHSTFWLPCLLVYFKCVICLDVISPSKYKVAFLSKFVFLKEGFPNRLSFGKGSKISAVSDTFDPPFCLACSTPLGSKDKVASLISLIRNAHTSIVFTLCLASL